MKLSSKAYAAMLQQRIDDGLMTYQEAIDHVKKTFKDKSNDIRTI